MAVEPTLPVQGLAVETEALKALQFYLHNYTTLMFTGLGPRNKKNNLGKQTFRVPLLRRQAAKKDV